jgi:dTMP kinase
MSDALFITFEGGDGSGKSDQITLFGEYFLDKYGPVHLTREPGGNFISEKIRELLLDKENKGIDGLTELFLFELARVESVREIAKQLRQRESVVSDRFYDSTTAYQGYGRGLPIDEITRLHNLIIQSIPYARHPDLTFLIDIPVEQGLKNASQRGKLNRLDEEKVSFHKKVRQGYLEIAKQNPQRIVVIPYQNGIEKVQKNIQEEFAKRYL